MVNIGDICTWALLIRSSVRAVYLTVMRIAGLKRFPSLLNDNGFGSLPLCISVVTGYIRNGTNVVTDGGPLEVLVRDWARFFSRKQFNPTEVKTMSTRA